MVDFKQKLKEAAISAVRKAPAGSTLLNLVEAAKGAKKEVEKRQEAAKPKTVSKSSTPIQSKAAERRISQSQPTQKQETTNQSSGRARIDMNNQDVKSMIVRIAQEEGVDPALALSIAQIESGFNPNAIGDNGKSQGLFQIYGPAHPDYKGGTDPEANTRYGLRMFKGLLDANGGSVNKAIWAYNAGQGNVNKGILPSSTKDYINKMAQLAPQYREQGYSSVAPVSQRNRAVIQSMAQGQQVQGTNTPPRIDTTVSQLSGVQKPEAVTTTPELDNLKAQLQALNNDPRNASLTIPSMYDRLVGQYAQMNNQIQTQDPRYQGNIVSAGGYYLDPEKYKAAMWRDKGAAMLGASDRIGGNAQQVLDEAKMMYQINMANQAGVPYEDYQAAMLDRQKQMISSQAAQIESELKMALANEDNVFKRQQLLQMIEQNGINAQNELNNLNYQIQNKNMVEQYKAQNNMNLQTLKNAYDSYQAEQEQKRKMQLATYQNQLDMNRDAAKQAAANSNPYSMLTPVANMAGFDPKTAWALINATGRGNELFPQMTPELANQIFGNSNPQPSQTGLFNNLRNYYQGGGLQANEQ